MSETDTAGAAAAPSTPFSLLLVVHFAEKKYTIPVPAELRTASDRELVDKLIYCNKTFEDAFLIQGEYSASMVTYSSTETSGDTVKIIYKGSYEDYDGYGSLKGVLHKTTTVTKNESTGEFAISWVNE